MPFSDLNAPYAALRVCVNETGPGRVSGLVYSQRLTAPIAFSDLGTLLLRVDEVLDVQKFPQAFQKGRSFSTKESHVPAADSPEGGLAAGEVDAQRGAIATFAVQILSRRNSSWQGNMRKLPDGDEREFFSALELMRMLEGMV